MHWLKICDTHCEKDTAKQYREILGYLDLHGDATVEMYRYESNAFCNRILKLTCGQGHDDLEMGVNSLSHGLRRLARKPKNIVGPKPFKVFWKVREMIEKLNEGRIEKP